MKYLVCVNDVEYGPIEQETLERWVFEGRVLKTTLVKEIDSDDWMPAKDLSVLQDALKKQASSILESDFKFKNRKEENIADKKIDRFFTLSDRLKENPDKIACDFIPSVSFIPRFFAALIDIGIILVLVFLLFIILNVMVDSKYSNINSVLYLFMGLAFYLAVLYYSCLLRIKAQTLGMSCVGIVIINRKGRLEKVSFMKVFFYTIFMICFNLLTIVFMFISSKNRSIQEIITGTKIIKKKLILE